MDSDAFDLNLDEPEKFKEKFLFTFSKEEQGLILNKEKIEYNTKKCDKEDENCILVSESKQQGSYEDYFIDSSICTKGEKHQLKYIDISDDYNELSKQFCKIFIGTKKLSRNKNKHSLGIFDSTNVKKNKLILNVFKQFSRNNRLQVNKLIKYIDYFLQNYLTKMPIKYVSYLKTKFSKQLAEIEEKKKAQKRAYINELINQYSNKYEGLAKN